MMVWCQRALVRQPSLQERASKLEREKKSVWVWHIHRDISACLQLLAFFITIWRDMHGQKLELDGVHPIFNAAKHDIFEWNTNCYNGSLLGQASVPHIVCNSNNLARGLEERASLYAERLFIFMGGPGSNTPLAGVLLWAQALPPALKCCPQAHVCPLLLFSCVSSQSGYPSSSHCSTCPCSAWPTLS